MLSPRGKDTVVLLQSDLYLPHQGTSQCGTVTHALMCPVLIFKATKTPGLRPATKSDLEEIHSLLQANIRKFHLSTILSLEEVEHWLLPRENVVDTYVVEVKIRFLHRVEFFIQLIFTNATGVFCCCFFLIRGGKGTKNNSVKVLLSRRMTSIVDRELK